MAGPCSTLIMTRSRVQSPSQLLEIKRKLVVIIGNRRGKRKRSINGKTNDEGGIGPTELKNLLNKVSEKVLSVL